MASEECEQCGWCCHHYSGTSWATTDDLLQWYDGGRVDILRYCSVVRDGEVVLCSALSRNDLAAIQTIDGWTDPETRTPLTTCPFLMAASYDRFICSIHAAKPRICRSCQPWEWGNNPFFESGCRAARKKKWTP